MKYRLDIRSLGIMLELTQEAYDTARDKEVIDEKTGDFLWNAKLLNIGDDTLLVVKESKFERVEE